MKCEVVLQWSPSRRSCESRAVAYYPAMGGGRMYLCGTHVQKHLDSAEALELRNADTDQPYGWSVVPARACKNCGHAENDHDGYGGMCDGLGGNSSREVCGCVNYEDASCSADRGST